MARVSHGLVKLRDQVNAIAPNRSKASDGTFGDPAHASRKSDHNPNARGIVCALDITHDPANGVDSEALANAVLASRDNRIKYVISNRKIASGQEGPEPFVWRKYTGANPHNHHCHISVLDPEGDIGGEWILELDVRPSNHPAPLPVLKWGRRVTTW